MSGTYNSILNVQDVHSYNNGNIEVSGTVLWVIHKHKKIHQWSRRSVYLNAKLLKIMKAWQLVCEDGAYSLY
jgi:hypothetical protein